MRHSFFCIDSHTCGNPVRLVAGGGPLLPHLPIAERREIFVRDHDWVRQALMFEPRGHDVMSGAIIYPAHRQDCDFAVIFIEVSGCLPMCGAGTIGLVTAAIEEGLVIPKVPGRLSIETPAGRVDIQYEKPGEFVESVRMFNVASYLHAADVEVEVPGLGRLLVDIAYGGNYYAVIEPQAAWRGLDGMSAMDIVDLSRKLRSALSHIIDPVHPQDDRISGVHHAIWCDKPVSANADGRGAVFYGDKAIDRSPGGTGTSARMAQLHGKGRLKTGERFRQESLIGTIFEGRVEEETDIGSFRGIMPSVSGWARIIGHNTIFVDDRDPLAHGFQIG
ncbi:4-hydroxyproline epimerase [Agrobacterium tumefaciens]|jgi:4-hydroxyproline epimerase|uniref:4-hydroxyproline epimerase n=1 Tax=Agrobacterium tumefaciens TaxID=358 RepID=A0AAP9E8S4_AGRTU|nr:4-hydroxyproline epimerase [Agrobacterium tumefaciens]KAA1233204.1 4-hydroxyproline epimerase [Agrobacterium tumefaciens]NSZ60537.1 4-hydroxyproline epimerase [Agrobacterium tumefaciens]QDY96894.1 4-hydroxyproline epimerase [Agrobacterium tumefaciens]QNP82506.1 4-hydroxyproline epimerase [Agrobacterium tumefaciens]UXS27069.1 4-hydroxyproline epimerase [Agrobacterium tumefaciens]